PSLYFLSTCSLPTGSAVSMYSSTMALSSACCLGDNSFISPSSLITSLLICQDGISASRRSVHSRAPVFSGIRWKGMLPGGFGLDRTASSELFLCAGLRGVSSSVRRARRTFSPRHLYEEPEYLPER